jgi:peptidoglycan/xylan/chitin deacetylase (PgdA/CDA1 family)
MRSGEPSRCVLTLHRVIDRPSRDHDVSWASFIRVLDTIDDDVTTDLRLRPDSGRSVVLTFDDGSVDHAEVGRALAERQLSGIFFVPAGTVGTTGCLTEGQLRELRATGHVIGSHGFHNIRFDGLTPAELTVEVRGSKTRLQEILGEDVRYLAPPGGSEHPLLVKELEQGGFNAARSVRWGMHRSDDERWRIPCIPVTELTISRGWVQRALAAWHLPLAMRFAWAAKELLPTNARSSVRAWSHRGFRG